MLDIKFIERKLELIKRDLARLTQYQDQSFSEVAKDWISFSAVKNLFMEIIGRAIDINFHLARELLKPDQNIPATYQESFLELGSLKILPEKFARQISKSAGFRNAVVHGYNQLDKYIVYQNIKEAIKEYTQYCAYILKLIPATASSCNQRQQ